MKFSPTLAKILSTTALAFSIPGAAIGADAGPPALGGTALDAAINGRVAAALMSDPGLEGARIVVDTEDGVVRLEGTVAQRGETGRALELAAGVEGVRRVDNYLAVESQ